MKKILIDFPSKIISKKKKIEETFNIKISNRGKEIFVDGNSEGEYYAEKVIDAMDFGFSFQHAILLKDENFSFEILNIKDYTRRKDLERIRARIIGKKGKTLKVLNELTECFFELNENKIGIIGESEYIKNAEEAAISIIKGAKQANVYSFLEKHRVKPIVDFGLK